jgi:gliding motility-associated-like protein
MKKDDIEDLFKQSFENYEPEVRPKVWKNVRVGLKWGSLAFFINAFVNKIGTTTLIAIVTSIVATVIGTVTFVNWNNSKKEGVSADTAITTSSPVAVTTVTDSNEQSSQTEAGVATNEPDQKSTVASTALPAGEKKPENTGQMPVDESIASISASTISGTAPLIIELSNTGTGKTNKWIFGDGKNNSSSINPTHVFETPGNYSIELFSTNASGKTDIDTVSVEVTGTPPVPNEFSPNGDGVSDVFTLKSQKIASMNIKIVDKNGTLVYKSDEAGDNNWDGKDLQGKDAPEGTYFYTIHAVSFNGKKHDKTGTVNLKR